MEKWNKISLLLCRERKREKTLHLQHCCRWWLCSTTCFIPFSKLNQTGEALSTDKKTLFGRASERTRLEARQWQRWKKDANDFQADTFHVHISILIAAISKAHLLLCTRLFPTQCHWVRITFISLSVMLLYHIHNFVIVRRESRISI